MAKAPAHTSMKINGIDVAERFGFVLTGGYPSGLGLPPIRPRLSTIPGRHGVRNHGAIYDAREIEIQGQIWADDFADAQDQLDDFKGWIALPQNLKKHLVGTRGIEGMKLELVVFRSGRYFLVTYNGTSEVSAMPGADEAWEGVEVFQFSVGFLCTPPFLIGDQVIKKITTTGFHEITGLGTAPVNPTYHIFGANTSPTKIVKAKHALTCDFKSVNTSGNPNKARDIFNDVDKTLTLTPAFRYMPARLAQGIGIFGNTIGNKGDVVTFTAMVDGSAPTDAIGDRLNRNQGTLSVWITPEWRYTTSRVRYILADGASGELTISYNPTSDRWEASDGTNVAFKASTHAAGSRIHLVVTWDKNANSLNITIDNSAGTGSSYAASTPSATVRIGSDSSSEGQIDAVVDDLGIWDIALSSAEISTLYNGGNGARADSVASDSLLVYLSFDGTQGTSIDVSTANLGGGNGVTLKSTTTTVTAVTVAGGGDNIFFDDNRIVIYDETGYKVEGFVKPTVSAISVPIELTKDAGDNLTNADKVGVYADFASQGASGGDVLDVGANSFHFSGWVNVDTLTSDRYIASKIDGSSTLGWYFIISSSGKLAILAKVSGRSITATSNGTIATGKLHHVAFLVDKSGTPSVTFYIDGVAQTTSYTVQTLLTADNLDNSSTFFIGRHTSALYFDGKIRDCRIQIAGTNVTAAQVLFQATNPLDYSSSGWTLDGTRDNWEFTDNDGTTTVTGATNNLTLSASSQWTQLAYISKNLFSDGGMENGGIGGWTSSDGALVPTKTTTAANIKKDTRAIQWISSAAHGIQQTIATASGEDWVWRFYARRSSAGGNLVINVGGVGNVFLDTDPTQTYTLFETCFEAASASPVLLIRRGGIEGTFQVDDVTIKPNLVNDGGLEGTYGTDTAGLNDNLDPVGSPTFAEETTKTHSGASSQEIVADGTAEDQGIISEAGSSGDVSITNNRWYEASCWVEMDSGTETINFAVTNGAGTIKGSTSKSVTTTFLRLSFIFLADATATDWRWKCYVNTVTGTFYIDDVSIDHRPDLDETLNPLASGFHYLPTRDYHGLYVRSGDTLVLSSIVANKDEFGFAIRSQPQFDSAVSTTGEDKTIFMFRFDATNFYRLYY
ncbi:hypothetical protein IH992_22300, partial [Candidatus Poribacteria bacterium]|nr:hypothetical protein [Candidatus Poribacteria bacterium]